MEKWQWLHLQAYRCMKTWDWSFAAASLSTPLEDSFTSRAGEMQEIYMLYKQPSF